MELPAWSNHGQFPLLALDKVKAKGNTLVSDKEFF